MQAIRVGEDVGIKVHSYIAGGIANLCSRSGKLYGNPLENLEWNHHLTQLSHPLVYTQRTSYQHTTVTATPILMAAQFTVARLWKPPRCPSVDEWIKKLWYIYTRRMKLWHLQVNGWGWRISC